MTDLIINLAEAFGRLKGAKAKGWIVTLLDAPMTLLKRIAQARDDLVLHLGSQLFFNRARIGVESIGEHSFWGNIGNVLSLLKEELGAAISPVSLNLESTRFPS